MDVSRYTGKESINNYDAPFSSDEESGDEDNIVKNKREKNKK